MVKDETDRHAMSATLLVTGAAGHLGQRVIAHLLDSLEVPANRIIATTRSPETIAAFAARGVNVRWCDFDEVASLRAAFAGAERALLISTDPLGPAGQRLVQHSNAIQAMVDAGVEHVVYTSMPEPEGSPILFAPDHAGTERSLAASPIHWTILRNCWYMENLFFSMPQAMAGGKWFSAAEDGRIAYISRDDCALAAAVALSDDEQRNITYTLTGREAFSASEIANMVSNIAAKPIEIVHVPQEGLVQGMIAHGLPEPVARTIASFDASTKAGGLAAITGDFEKLTGCMPMRFSDWLAANKAALAG